MEQSVPRFSAQTIVAADPDTPGRYHGQVGRDWNSPVLPQGGVVAALGLRAMAAELDDPGKRLRTVSVTFVDKVPPGPVEIDVRPLRSGRTMSQAVAEVRPVGTPAGLIVTAVFGTSRPGFEFTDLEPPQAGSPDQAPSWDDRPDDFTFWEDTIWDVSIESRLAVGHFPWSRPWEATSSERVVWLRYRETPRLDDGKVDPLALVAICDMMPGAIAERMGPDCPFFLAPSADLSVHVLADARSDWFLARNRCRFAGDGYASLDMELWDTDIGLVAYATQVAFFSFPDQGRSLRREREPTGRSLS